MKSLIARRVDPHHDLKKAMANAAGMKDTLLLMILAAVANYGKAHLQAVALMQVRAATSRHHPACVLHDSA